MAKNRRPDNQRTGSDNGLQFRISEVSSLLNVSASTLRQWENVGLTSPSRTKGGYRTYSSQQIERLKVIQNLRFKNGLNMVAIRQFLDKSEPAAARVAPRENEIPIGRRRAN